MRRRVLHVITGFDAAGAEMVLARVASRLPADRWTCRVVGLGPEGPVATILRQHGTDTVALGATSTAGAFRLGVRLARAARAFQPDLIHGWMYHGNLAATWAAAFTAPRSVLVWGVRQGLYDRERSPFGTRAAIRAGAWLSRVPARILYNSVVAARQHEAAGYSALGTRIVPNGYDLAEFGRDDAVGPRLRGTLGLQEDDEVILLAARWHPVKDHAGFAAAAARLAPRRPSARFVLCGRGVDERNVALLRLLQDSGIRHRCLLLGERRDLPELLRVADLATLSSRGEAFPNALAEAMAAGVPCVGPDVGDVSDLVGDTGVVVPPGDPERLAAAWDALLSLPAARRVTLGESARERIRTRFSLDRSVSELEAVYREVLEPRET